METCDICVITTIHPPMDQRIYGRGVRSYLKAGYSVALVAPWPRPTDGDADGVLWREIPILKSRRYKLAHAYRAFRTALSVKARLYHFHDLDFIIFGALLRLLSGAAVVYDDHENYREDILYNKPWIPRFLRWPIAAAVSLIEAACAKAIGNVLVPVEGMESRFRSLGLNAEVVHNYSSYKVRRDLSYGDGLVYIGSVTETYGLSTLIGIARELKRRGRGITLFLTEKNADEKTKRLLASLVADEGLAISLHPVMPFTKMHEFMALGRIGLSVMKDSPEKRISIASKIFEYMAYGLPVVGENFGHTARIVTDSGCGVVADAADILGITDAILTLYDDQSKLSVCREKGFAAIEDRYNWVKEEAKLLAFTQAIIGEYRSMYS